MTLNELIKELQEMKRDFGGHIEVCVCPESNGETGVSIDYPEVVDVKKTGRNEYLYLGSASPDSMRFIADRRAVFIYREH